jgi:cell division protein FtsL
MSDQGGLQLLPETRKKINVKIPGENRMVYIGSVLMVVVVALFFYYNNKASSMEAKIMELDQQIAAVEKSRDKKAEAQIADLKKQTTLLNRMLAEHIFWSQAWSKLEDLVSPQLQIKDLSLSSTKEEISFSAKAPSYAAVAKQLAKFTNDEAIKDTVVSGIRLGSIGAAEFDMKLSIDGKKFFKKIPVANGTK